MTAPTTLRRSSALARLERDPDVTVLRQAENRGPSAARNRALEQLETSYFLPIDADDELLPDALERMLERLERAPEDVGFVYPNAQHIGNQDNYVASPAYNLWLLMEQNYCPAPALFDRRLFEGDGVSYPEEIVVGHEDWDLVLQLAERDVRGVPIEGPTFLYRKQGFSRVHAVDYGPESFDKTIQGRHPHLYRNRDAIKAKWAPALSIVLLDEEGDEWGLDMLTGVDGQTCPDFELLARRNLGDVVRGVGASGESPGAWLQTAIDAAHGRWVLLLPCSVAAVLGSRSFVEQLVHAFAANDGSSAVVLAGAPGVKRVAFAQLDDRERRAAKPAAIAFERPLWGRGPAFRLGVEESLLADLVVGLRNIGPVQWRVAPVAGEGRPWSEPGGPSDGEIAIDVNTPRPEDQAVAAMHHMVAHQPPRLPELTRDRVRRWKESEPWTPPQSRLLCRHLDLKTGFRTITPERRPIKGHRFERVLGCTHIFAAPGTSRLVHANHSYELTDEQGALPDGSFDMGYVEQQPLPLLEGLELRRVPETGQEILVAGRRRPADPQLRAGRVPRLDRGLPDPAARGRHSPHGSLGGRFARAPHRPPHLAPSLRGRPAGRVAGRGRARLAAPPPGPGSRGAAAAIRRQGGERAVQSWPGEPRPAEDRSLARRAAARRRRGELRRGGYGLTHASPRERLPEPPPGRR